ncbi:MAG: 3-phosphoshikimate 1-carboxyvinyltransferase [Actinomycetota bacterium]|nr:3-phosphoshikimate 1-carboxyvinyltransferase [Actinomycetota bacterium]
MGIRRSTRSTPLRGTIALPGDKSVSHRALLLAGLAAGRSLIANLNPGRDVAATRAAVEAFGVGVTEDLANDVLEVEGSGRAGLREPSAVVDAGNSGTTARLLMGVAAGIPGQTVITGDSSLRVRPMLRVVAPLRQMGARIDGRDHGEHLPVTIRGGPLAALEHHPDVPSAQVKGALLLAGLSAEGTTAVVEPAATRDHTERMLAAAGVTVTIDGARVALEGGTDPSARSWHVPGDISAAMFFIVAASIMPGSDISITGVGLNPSRTKALQVLTAMGADIEIRPNTDAWAAEPIGAVRVRASELHSVDIGPADVVGIIDELPAIAVAATQAEGVTAVTGAAELRVKESDRIDGLAQGLGALGARIETSLDGFAISGPTRLGGGEADPQGDHRMAMAFAVAGLVASGKVRVRDWSCVDVSFPGFADLLASIQAKRA